MYKEKTCDPHVMLQVGVHCELAKVMTVMTLIDLIVKWILTVKFVARRCARIFQMAMTLW
jgi:hypothetical protein